MADALHEVNTWDQDSRGKAESMTDSGQQLHNDDGNKRRRRDHVVVVVREPISPPMLGSTRSGKTQVGESNHVENQNQKISIFLIKLDSRQR